MEHTMFEQYNKGIQSDLYGIFVANTIKYAGLITGISGAVKEQDKLAALVGGMILYGAGAVLESVKKMQRENFNPLEERLNKK